jgi:regulator of protease activity HflC (stomatin/prohibitin superfamily)
MGDFNMFFLPAIPGIELLLLFPVIFAVAAILLIKATYLVKQAEVVIIERLGKFHTILYPGIHITIPFVDTPHSMLWTFAKEDGYSRRVVSFMQEVTRIDLRESVYDFPRQSVITKDNVTIQINALLYYQITDPRRAAYEVNNLPLAIEKLTQTTLRNIIGSMDLDETLISRDQINEKLRVILDDATDKWGVKINRVELQEVTPPEDIRHAMEQQMRAERSRRALILEAEGQKSSEILKAEGDKQSRVERAEGEAQAKRITAQGEADAIELLTKALAGKDPVAYMIATNYIKILPELLKGGEGKTVVLPYESSALMGSLASIKELLSGGAK